MPETPEKNIQAALIGFYGYSNSGKTTLIERLIGDLRAEGLRVAAVKVSEQALSLDQPGKDSDRYAQAGANGVASGGARGERFPLPRTAGAARHAARAGGSQRTAGHPGGGRGGRLRAQGARGR